ncbi:MAG TPA: hypothetical protein VFX43_03340 [Chitinophagaceae bacterium]|jgi:hypothetical protein|nr:hypothetical protein [Chitinophagaceae bacterium]
MDRFYILLIAIFCGINGLGIAYSHVLELWGIVNVAGMLGNILIAAVTALSYYFSFKGMQVESGHAFVRGVFLSTFIKMLICAAAVVIYVSLFKQYVTKGTLILFFLLYILYTILETASLMKVAKSKSR